MVDILKLRKMSDSKSEIVKKDDSSERADLDAVEKESTSKTMVEKSKPSVSKPNIDVPKGPGVPVKKDPPENIANPSISSEMVDKVKSDKQDLKNNSAKSDEEVKALDLIIFSLADRLFSIDIMKVQEVVRFNEITRVPNAAKFVLGVMNLRGNITPVIDLHKRFSLAEAEWSEKTRIIVLQIQNQAIGFLVDHVSEIMHTYESDINSTPSIHAGIGTEYITGVVKIKSNSVDKDENKLMILLNLENILEESSVTLN